MRNSAESERHIGALWPKMLVRLRSTYISGGSAGGRYDASDSRGSVSLHEMRVRSRSGSGSTPARVRSSQSVVGASAVLIRNPSPGLRLSAAPARYAYV